MLIYVHGTNVAGTPGSLNFLTTSPKGKAAEHTAAATGGHGSCVEATATVGLCGRCAGEAGVRGVGRARGAVLVGVGTGPLILRGASCRAVAAAHHVAHEETAIGYAETPDLAYVVLGDVALEDLVADLEEDLARDESIRAGLVSRADALYLERLGNVLETGLGLELMENVRGLSIARGHDA